MTRTRTLSELKRRLNALAKIHPTMKLLPPVPERKLVEVEGKLGVDLPGEWRAFLADVSAGAKTDDSYFHSSFAEVVARTKKRAVAKLFPFDGDDVVRSLRAYYDYVQRGDEDAPPDYFLPGNAEGAGVLWLYEDGCCGDDALVVTGSLRGTMWTHTTDGWCPLYRVVRGKPVLHTFTTWFTDWLSDEEKETRARAKEKIRIARSSKGIALFERGFTHFPAAVLAATQLEHLDLCSNRIETVPPQIERLQKLHTLHLIDNRISRLPDALGSLTRLRDLRLGENLLTELPQSLSALQMLEVLTIDRNRFRHVPRVIDDLPALRELALGGNRIPAAEIARLRRRRRGLKIIV